MQAFLEPEIFDGTVGVTRRQADRREGRQLRLVEDRSGQAN
jgi:hypothetical protein